MCSALDRILLSINRFESKKNLPLALEAFARWRKTADRAAQGIVMVFAGTQRFSRWR